LLAFVAGLTWAAAAEVDAQAHAVDWTAVGRWTVLVFCAIVLARPLCAGLRALARLAVPALFAFLLLSLFDLTGFLTRDGEIRRFLNKYLLGELHDSI
jgi:hypothetical protein